MVSEENHTIARAMLTSGIMAKGSHFRQLCVGRFFLFRKYLFMVSQPFHFMASSSTVTAQFFFSTDRSNLNFPIRFCPFPDPPTRLCPDSPPQHSARTVSALPYARKGPVSSASCRPGHPRPLGPPAPPFVPDIVSVSSSQGTWRQTLSYSFASSCLRRNEPCPE